MPDPASVGVLSRTEGGVARIVLDRPRALNALTLPMVHAISELLERWRSQPLRAITIESSTAGVFCAGGDIRMIRQNTLDENPAASDGFFAAEYLVNETLASYPVPVVALIDGVCMGGGMGLSIHAPFRVVTERAVLAMPETAIGFFPDVGASYFLTRLPGAVGTYLGLTGARIRAADALDVGLATHHVPSGDLPSVVRALLEEPGPVEAILRRLVSTPQEPPPIAANRASIDAAFTATSVDAIAGRLLDDGRPWAVDAHAALRGASPQSLDLTLDLILWGRQRTLRECLDAERAAARHVVGSADFLEGVRAALVDKDRAPVWGASGYAGVASDGEIRWARESETSVAPSSRGGR